MIKKLFGLLLFVALFSSCSKKNELVDYVDPFIGTGGHGHTYPGASLPFGMVQLSPDTRLEGWDGCSGYHFSDSIIYGFSHTHLSGTGCSDYGDILLMPTATNPTFNNGSEGENGYSSSFKKDNEIAKPGFYKVYLDDNKVDVELSCSKRVGLHKYTFDEEDTVNVILDLVHRDVLRESDIIKIGDNKIEGKRISSAWAKEQHIYFAIEFSQPIQNMYGQVRNKKDYFIDSDAKDPLQKAIFGFRLDKSKELLVKVAISAVSTEGAWKNMEAEIPHWDFEKVKNEAKKEWNKELGKIKVEGGTESQKTIFYSALYHSMLAPNLYSDVDGKYRGRDLQIHEADGFDYYTVFSLWDTYRGEHPLLTIIDEKRTNDFIKTMIRQYLEGWTLPVWELGANETMCMIGYHSIPVIADAYLKGIRDFDAELAFEAMKHSANIRHLGISEYKTFGYIPANLEHESVSKTLEYAYDDWCIAQMAKELGKTEDFENYIKRAQFYKNIIDSNGFARPKMNGSWLHPFDPKEVNIHYTEANSWQYSFYAPQDVSGLMEMKGGKEKFIENLDQLFAESTETTGREQADITGLIGQYAHGNEPSHHIAYLYSFAGAPWKTQEITRRIMDELYSNQTDGYCGNEDCGQMSAWYVLSAMGFYPVCPGSNEYVFGSPIFDKVTIQLENGKEFVIEAKNNSKENKYIQSCTLNENKYEKSFITHEEILKGGTLSFEMDEKPNKEWCSNKGFPVSKIEAERFLKSPTLVKNAKTFNGELSLKFFPVEKEDTIFYALVENENTANYAAALVNPESSLPAIIKDIPYINFQKYLGPITINESTYIVAYMQSKGIISHPTIAGFSKIKQDKTIKLYSTYSNQYTGGGDQALIDQQRGTTNWRVGRWQGYEGVDFEATIDFDEAKDISRISVGFLQDSRAWIFFPEEVIFYVSAFDHKYSKVATVYNTADQKDETVLTQDFTANFDKQKAVSIKIVAKNIKTVPEWHLGAGGKTWLFLDEIVVE